jgi:hypothetical protein
MIVVFVRHAEPVAGPQDPGLSAAGVKRAAALARVLGGAGITAVFTSEFRRTKETAAPLSGQLTIAPVEIDSDPTAAAGQIKAADTVPLLIAALGGPTLPDIEHTVFDRMFVLQVPATADSLLSLRYGA